MASTSPTLLTPEEAAAIARCSTKTVRRAYASGALTAYRRRGSRAVLLDKDDVVDWVRGQVVVASSSSSVAEHSAPVRLEPRRSVRKPDGKPRVSKHGGERRADLSVDALRARRGLKLESLVPDR